MEGKRNGPRWCRWSWMMFLCLGAAGSCLAQDNPSGPLSTVEILKIKWEKQVALPRNFDPSVLPANGVLVDTAPTSPATAPPTLAPTSSGAVSDQTRAATSARSAAAGSSTAFPNIPGRLPISYVYSMKIKNIGPKTIEGIAWDYLFIDPNGNKVLGSHQFMTYEKVTKDKVVTLRGQLRSPLTRVVQAPDSKDKQPPKFTERAVIECVLYSDETVWRSAQAKEGVCDLLKNGSELNKRKHRAEQSR